MDYLFPIKLILLCCLLEKVVNSEIVNILGLGKLRGSTTTTARSGKLIYQFLGVNYAEPPTKEYRFKAPVPVRLWSEVRNVQKNKFQCPQINDLIKLRHEGIPIGDYLEDCLHMSIYTKNLTLNQNVPVMVYIHGGSFYEGGASDHPPNYFLEKDIVLVVPQYRLGPLGFLSTMTDDIPGNAGVLDVILALKWIQKYIHYFGGNPNGITLFGQSAGAALISALQISPTVPKNLFHKIILQSGSIFSPWSIDLNPVKNSRDIADRCGCKGNATIDELNKCFENVDLFSLIWGFTEHMKINEVVGVDLYGGAKITIGGPTNILPVTPLHLLLTTSDRNDHLPMMVGVTKHDGSYDLSAAYDALNETIGFNDGRINSFKMIDIMNRFTGIQDDTGSLNGFMITNLFTQEQLINGSFLNMLPGMFDLHTMNTMKGPALRAAQSNAFLTPHQTYLYTFDYEGEFTRFGYGADTSHYPFEGGIYHSNDIIYLFPYPPFAAQLNEIDSRMSEIMIDLWTSFAIDGVPSSSTYEKWPALTNVIGPYLHIDKIGRIGSNFLDEYTITVQEGLPHCSTKCLTEFEANPGKMIFKLSVQNEKLVSNRIV